MDGTISSENVFSTDPAIVIVELQKTHEEFGGLLEFRVYLEGENVGVAYSQAEAREIASEVFASVTGEPQEEEGI